jgi:putative ABC transport system permease protein
MASGTLPGTMGFIHLLRRSLVYRKGRVAAMLAGLTLSAAVVTALLGIYADLNAKLNLEFRSFGANVVLTAANDASLPDDIATQVGHIAGPGASAVPLAFAVADLPDQTPVVIAGTDLKAVKAMNPWWKLTSRGNEHGVIAGERAWQAAGSPTQMALRFNGKNLTLPVSATLSTGEDDDSRIFMETSDFFPWTGKNYSVVELRVPGTAAQVTAVIEKLRAQFPTLDVRPIRQIVEGQTRVVGRTQRLMFASSLIIGLTIAIAVLSLLSATVFERRFDYAVMKALGSSRTRLYQLFLAEVLLLAGVGAVAGLVVGVAAAWLIGAINFHANIAPHPELWPLTLLVNLVVALVATLGPLRQMNALRPAELLRGE